MEKREEFNSKNDPIDWRLTLIDKEESSLLKMKNLNVNSTKCADKTVSNGQAKIARSKKIVEMKR